MDRNSTLKFVSPRSIGYFFESSDKYRLYFLKKGEFAGEITTSGDTAKLHMNLTALRQHRCLLRSSSANQIVDNVFLKCLPLFLDGAKTLRDKLVIRYLLFVELEPLELSEVEHIDFVEGTLYVPPTSLAQRRLSLR